MTAHFHGLVAGTSTSIIPPPSSLISNTHFFFVCHERQTLIIFGEIVDFDQIQHFNRATMSLYVYNKMGNKD